MSTQRATIADLLPDRRTVLFGTLVLNAELLALFLYAASDQITILDPRYALYGLVWLNVGGWVLLRTEVDPPDEPTHRRALAVGVGYFLLLAWTGGLLGPGVRASLASGVSVVWLPPGWGPALVYRGTLFSAVVMPAKVVGYLGLAYLVYATVVDAATAAVSGLLGLLSCVSCTWPVLASLAATVFGSGSALAAATMTNSYGLSTAVFLVTVALLSWRPRFGGR